MFAIARCFGPLRDEVLRVNGYQVESTTEADAARKRLAQKDFDL